MGISVYQVIDQNVRYLIVSKGSEKAMTYKNVKVVVDERYIAGLFRDAILNTRAFIIENAHGDIYQGTVNQFQETKARARTDKRIVEIRVKDFINTAVNETLSFRCSFSRFLLTFKVEKYELHNGIVSFPIPTQVELVLLRKSVRIDTKYISATSSPVLLRTNKNEYICSGRIIDVSENGFGLLLKIGNELEGELKSLSCKLITEHGVIEVAGKIVWTASDNDLLKVGVELSCENLKSDKTPSGKERRKQERVNINWPLELISPINPKFISQFELIDISHQGFKARIINPAEKVLFPINTQIKVRNLDVLAQVVRSDSGTYSFLIKSNSKYSIVRLSKLITTFSNRDISLSTPATEDVLEVFTTSGSISTSLANTQSTFYQSILDSLESTGDKSSWYLRWFQRTDFGQIRGTVSTILYGDSLWYNGALAGHLDSDLKISKDFVRRYYRHLHGFLSAFKPEQLLFFNWFTDNIWWSGWENYLTAFPEDRLHFRFKGYIVYFKPDYFKYGLRTENSHVRNLRSESLDAISEHLESIRSSKHKTILNLLGWNLVSFGSEHLKDLIQGEMGSFNRDYIQITGDNFQAYVVLNKFPEGITPNGIINYPYVLITKTNSEFRMREFSDKLLEVSANFGILPSAFFLAFDDGVEYTQSFEDERLVKREVIWTLGTKRLLQFWLDDEE